MAEHKSYCVLRGDGLPCDCGAQPDPQGDPRAIPNPYVEGSPMYFQRRIAELEANHHRAVMRNTDLAVERDQARATLLAIARMTNAGEYTPTSIIPKVNAMAKDALNPDAQAKTFYPNPDVSDSAPKHDIPQGDVTGADTKLRSAPEIGDQIDARRGEKR